MGIQVPELIAQRIRAARTEKGLGKGPFGKLVGLRQGQVSALERSEPVRLTAEVIESIRHVLGIDIQTVESPNERPESPVYLLHVEQGIQVVSAVVEQELIRDLQRNPSRIHALDRRLFEELIAELWNGFGYTVELTKRTKDGGKDIIAISEVGNVSSKYLIECKRPDEGNKIGVSPVRELYGVKVSDGATKAILATTSFFSRDAKQFLSKHRWELEGRDYDGILDWIDQYLQERSD